MILIIITVLILLIILTNAIKDYYYKSLEDIMTSQMEYSIDLYSRYYSSLSMNEILVDDIDIFGRHDNLQFQLLSLDGELLMDSLGAQTDSHINTSDVADAIRDGKGVWIGNVDYDSYPVMAVSMPLKGHGEAIGIVRFVSSLKETNKIIQRITMLLVSLGVAVVVVSGIVGIFLSNSIVKPLVELTRVAEKMADGQLRVRSTLELDDEIGRLSNTLNYMADEVLKREEIKNDFISSVSHELRTPLTSIKGWAMTLQADDIRDENLTKDGLKIIENESDRLAQMVEELLDFSRFVSGRITLEKDIFDIGSALETVSRQYMPRAKEKKIDFSLHVNEDVDYFLGDENRIKQVLINLLDNAFKFTNEGGKVKLSAYKTEKNLVLQVKDTGIGIPDDDLPHIKEKFYKGKNSKSQSGIGLSICDEIVKLHDGALKIKSKLNYGTTVEAILPIKEEEV